MELDLNSQSYQRNRPFHFFFSTFDIDKLAKIRRLRWRELLYISTVAKFEGDLSIRRYIAPQNREILQMFVGGGGGGGACHPP